LEELALAWGGSDGERGEVFGQLDLAAAGGIALEAWLEFIQAKQATPGAGGGAAGVEALLERLRANMSLRALRSSRPREGMEEGEWDVLLVEASYLTWNRNMAS
jgi:hypothetical protein